MMGGMGRGMMPQMGMNQNQPGMMNMNLGGGWNAQQAPPSNTFQQRPMAMNSNNMNMGNQWGMNIKFSSRIFL